MFGSREPENPLDSAPPAAEDPEIGATPPKTHDPDREIRLLEGRAGSERDPEGRAFAPLADAYRKAGRLDEAARVVEEGTQRLPDYATGHVVAGLVHRDRGDSAAARAAFYRALELDPANRTALRTLAEIHLESGEVAEARSCCDRLEEAGSEDERLRERLEYPAPPASEPPRPGEDHPGEGPHPGAYADPLLASDPPLASGPAAEAAEAPGEAAPEQGDPGDAGLLDLDEGSLDLDPSGLHEEAREEPALPPEPGAGEDLDLGEGEGLDLDLDLSGLEDVAAGTEDEGAPSGIGDAAAGSDFGAREEEAAPAEEAPGAEDAVPSDDAASAEEESPVEGAPLEEVPSDGLLPLDPAEFEEPSAGGRSPGDRGSPGAELDSPGDELDPGPAGAGDLPDPIGGPDPGGDDAPGPEGPGGGQSAFAGGSRSRDFLDPEELDASSLGLDPFEAGRGAFGAPESPFTGEGEGGAPSPDPDPEADPGREPVADPEPAFGLGSGMGTEPADASAEDPGPEGISEPDPGHGPGGASGPEPTGPAGESGGGPGAGGAGDPVTRTMGDLYAAQGHYDRAVAVYEQLVEREPGNFHLQARLEQLRAQARRPAEEGAASAEREEGGGGGGDVPGPERAPAEGSGPEEEGRGSPPEPEGQAPHWVEEAERDEELGLPSPFAWAEEVEPSGSPKPGGEASPSTGRSARQYFDDLLAWVPGAVPIENLAPDGPTERSGETPGPSRPDREGASDATGTGEESGEGDLDDFQSWLGRFGP